jgi:hypothetical protein
MDEVGTVTRGDISTHQPCGSYVFLCPITGPAIPELEDLSTWTQCFV